MASLSHKSAHAKLMADKNRLQQGIGLKTTNFHFIRLGSLMFFLCSGLPMWLVCRGKFTEYAFHIFLEFQINLIFFFLEGNPLYFYLKASKEMDFPGGSDSKESAYSAGGLNFIPGSGRSAGGGWQPTPVFLPGESHGRRSLPGYSPWGSQRVRHD